MRNLLGEFINDLLARTRFAAEDAVRVCILDTGVDRGHPLLDASLGAMNLQAWEEAWGADDHDWHGTLLAGVWAGGPAFVKLCGCDPCATAWS